MSYNGSGTFNINTTGQPVVTGTVISSSTFNALTADLGTGLSTAITKDGQTVATARIPFAQGINSSLVTDATSTTTGSIITAGGVGIAKALFVGTTANIAGTTTLAGVTATSITDSGLTSGRVTYAGTAGLLQDSANLTFNGTTLTANTIGAFTLSGTVAGGGNQLNNVIIGTTTPLAGAFTTLSATGTISNSSSSGPQLISSTSSIASGYAQLKAIANVASINVQALGSTIGGTTFAGLTGNNQVIVEAVSSSSFVLSTAEGGTNIVIAPFRTAIGTFSSTGLAVTGDISLPTTNQLGWGASPYTCAIEGASGASGYIRLFTNNAERMRLDSSGNLLVGCTNTLNVASSGQYIATGNDSYHGVGHNGSSSGASYTAYYYNSGYIGGITQNGTTAVAYNTSSDYRLKENIAPMTGALAKVALLKPCTYTWKTAPEEVGEGFIAHELSEVCPNAVTGEKDAVEMQQYEISPAVPATQDEEGNEVTAAVEAVMGEREVPRYQGIDTSFLVATLTAAIQEQQAIITALTTRITALEAK